MPSGSVAGSYEPVDDRLASAVSVIKAWAYENIEELERAREQYDQAPEAVAEPRRGGG